jgi:hypothetical protein
MDTCKNCGNYTYDLEHYEFRCKHYNHRIKDIYKYIDCESHKKKDGEKDDSAKR